MTTANMTIQTFLDALAAQQPTPGGGGAAALTGAQAAALVSMVINFTIGNKKYAAVEEAMRGYLQASETLRHELLDLADRDVAAFTAVAACYAMPRASDGEKVARTAALQQALKDATQVPFETAEKCLALLRLVKPVGEQGNANVVSDAATAFYLVSAAIHSALVNVNINLKLIKDGDFVAQFTARRNHLLDETNAAYHAAKIACEKSLGIGL
jgi:formiminotetrahydrofolate cyclodeaminase